MWVDYKGYRIATWIDDDTSHAQMLKGKRGPERLYVDIDPLSNGDGRQPPGKRFGQYVLTKHTFVGTVEEQMIEVGKLWVDSPEQFASPEPRLAFHRPESSVATRKPKP
ncbi:MAG: hypothetical protein J0I79_16950 [Mesorhizobium sp.]|uniref:hypothetical protein n=1 Tax=Mesorhizobium sp. TaxID=1871066 RepID=UPI001AC058E4|nr:hypothetical protein [Mesorhizobium sp.]MBN9219634.1 hypothetical protein [Mesorhizobium sp.]